MSHHPHTTADRTWLHKCSLLFLTRCRIVVVIRAEQLAVFEFQVFALTNLIPDPGPPPSQGFATNQTNGNRQVNDTFTVGTEPGTTIAIEDNENTVFEDDTDTPQFLDSPLTVGAFSFAAGTQVQNEFFLETDQMDANGDPILIIALRFQPATGGLVTVAYATTSPLPPGTTFTVTDATNRPVGTTGVPYPNIAICYAAGTMIRVAPDKEVPIESLVPGDLVETLDKGKQPVRWVGSRTLSKDRLQKSPNLRPIRIKAGALAKGVPDRDLIVSPQHRIFLTSKIVERMFDTNEILVAAKHLLDLPGVEIAMDMQSVTYVHCMLDDHEIVQANGAFAETLYTGTEAMTAMSPEAREEIGAIFGGAEYLNRPLARPTAKGRKSRKLIERHTKNNKSVVLASPKMPATA